MQNQHYLNKSLVKRFSSNGSDIYVLHKGRFTQTVDNPDGSIRFEKIIVPQDDIKQANIDTSAFCSQDGFSSGDEFWTEDFEKLLNDKVENNLFVQLFDSNQRAQKSKTALLTKCEIFNRLGIEVYELDVRDKLKSKLHAFIHVNHQLSHYEPKRSVEYLEEYISKVEDKPRMTLISMFKVFHIKFDPAKVVGKIVVDEFSSGFDISKKVIATEDAYKITNSHLLVGEYELLYLSKWYHDIPSFIFGQFPIIDEMINLDYFNCSEIEKQQLKSTIIGSDTADQLQLTVDMFNSDEFRKYKNIERKHDEGFVTANNSQTAGLYNEFNECYMRVKKGEIE